MSFDERFTSRWENIIAPAISSIKLPNGDYLHPYRTDISTVSDSVLTEIEDCIATALLVFVDISTVGHIGNRAVRNGNVMYELGLAHAVRLPEEVLIFRSDDDPLPFDTANVRVISYEPDGEIMGPAFEKVVNCVTAALEEIELIKHKTVEEISRRLDLTAFRELLLASSEAGLRPPPRKSMGEIARNSAKVDAINRLIDYDLVTTDIVESKLEIKDPRKVSGGEVFDSMIVYRITPLGVEVLMKLRKRAGPHLAALGDKFNKR
jgi:hypothetical protein